MPTVNPPEPTHEPSAPAVGRRVARLPPRVLPLTTPNHLTHLSLAIMFVTFDVPYVEW